MRPHRGEQKAAPLALLHRHRVGAHAQLGRRLAQRRLAQPLTVVQHRDGDGKIRDGFALVPFDKAGVGQRSCRRAHHASVERPVPGQEASRDTAVIKRHGDGEDRRWNQLVRQWRAAERSLRRGGLQRRPRTFGERFANRQLVGPILCGIVIAAVRQPVFAGLDAFGDLVAEQIVRLGRGDLCIAPARMRVLLDLAGIELRVRQGSAHLRLEAGAPHHDSVAHEIELAGNHLLQR